MTSLTFLRAELPTATFQSRMESLPRSVEAVIAAKRGLSLKQDVLHAHMGMMARCSHIFGHIVYALRKKSCPCEVPSQRQARVQFSILVVVDMNMQKQRHLEPH